jgi:chromosome segregation ATPase
MLVKTNIKQLQYDLMTQRLGIDQPPVSHSNGSSPYENNVGTRAETSLRELVNASADLLILAREEIVRLTVELTAARVYADEIEAGNQQLQARQDILLSESLERQQLIERLEAEITRLTDALEASSQASEASSVRTEDLTALETQLQEASAKLRIITEERDEALSQVTALQEERDALALQQENTANAGKLLEERLALVQEELDAANVEIAQLKDALSGDESLADDYSALEAQVAQLRQQIESLTTINEGLQAELSQKVNRGSQAEEDPEYDETSKEKDALRPRLDEATATIANMTEQLGHMETQIAELQKKISEYEDEEVPSLKRALERTKAQLRQKKIDIEELEADRQAIIQERDSLKAKHGQPKASAQQEPAQETLKHKEKAKQPKGLPVEAQIIFLLAADDEIGAARTLIQTVELIARKTKLPHNDVARALALMARQRDSLIEVTPIGTGEKRSLKLRPNAKKLLGLAGE